MAARLARRRTTPTAGIAIAQCNVGYPRRAYPMTGAMVRFRSFKARLGHLGRHSIRRRCAYSFPPAHQHSDFRAFQFLTEAYPAFSR